MNKLRRAGPVDITARSARAGDGDAGAAAGRTRVWAHTTSSNGRSRAAADHDGVVVLRIDRDAVAEVRRDYYVLEC